MKKINKKNSESHYNKMPSNPESKELKLSLIAKSKTAAGFVKVGFNLNLSTLEKNSKKDQSFFTLISMNSKHPYK
jgi:hypothetical protein